MIYVSSSSLRYRSLKKSVHVFVKNGYRRIELSGGFSNYKNLENDLLSLKIEYGLEFIFHHYFPSLDNEFVLNLASNNDSIYTKSLNHLLASIKLSKKIGISRFGFHAGYFVDLKANELGKRMKKRKIKDKAKAISRFCKAFDKLKKEAAGQVDLYLENNVVSLFNYRIFCGENPFMLTNYDDYNELHRKIEFKLLLDCGHLKVTCNSLRLNFFDELRRMAPLTDYYHISDNDGFNDRNYGLRKNSLLCTSINKFYSNRKIFTLEINGLKELNRSYHQLIGAKNDR